MTAAGTTTSTVRIPSAIRAEEPPFTTTAAQSAAVRASISG
jgi:hypothetical protein